VTISLVTTRKKEEAMNDQNLQPFKPGQSGNPSGRPKKTPLEKTIQKLLDDDEVQYRLARCLVAHAKQGNMTAMKLLMKCANPVGQSEPQATASSPNVA